MDQKEVAKKTIDAICGKLQRAVEALQRHEVGGRLVEADQHAVRILESRQRLLERLFLFVHGLDAEKDIAKVELMVRRNDDGSLIQLGEKKHGVGRLECRACDRAEDGSREAKLCPTCRSGIQHVFTTRIDGADGVEIEGGNLPPVPVLQNALRSRQGLGTGDFLVVRVRECDNCTAQEFELVGLEKPKVEQMKYFYL